MIEKGKSQIKAHYLLLDVILALVLLEWSGIYLKDYSMTKSIYKFIF